MASTTVFFAVFVFATHAVTTEATAFLRSDPTKAAQRINVAEVEAAFLSEFTGAWARGLNATDGRFARIETALLPIFRALPKNEFGNLGHAVVSYALHRWFVQQHGWIIKGLNFAATSNEPSSVLAERVPLYVQGLLEQRLGGRGANLHELALLIATIEDIVHNDAIERLKVIYRMHGFQLSDVVDDHRADEIIDTYMVVYILGGSTGLDGSLNLMELHAAIRESYPDWQSTRMWAHDMRRNINYAEQSHRSPFSDGAHDFATIARAIEGIGEGFGRFQDSDCKSIKHRLLESEVRGTGRVLLADFYRRALDGELLFQEKIEYLRALGALDESNPKRPSVIIPNYLGSPGNCVTDGSFYSVCCRDECEDLMTHIERDIGKPTAEPSRIAELVENLASDTIEAPRVLDARLLGRLSDLAESHGGEVPLHSRLFAQWMHHAYPRECPYPHEYGTTNPLTADDWMDLTGHTDIEASEAEMWRYARKANITNSHRAIEDHQTHELPWTQGEELIGASRIFPPRSADGWSLWALIRNIMLSGLLLSVALSTMGPASSVSRYVFPSSKSASGVYLDKAEKYCV